MEHVEPPRPSGAHDANQVTAVSGTTAEAFAGAAATVLAIIGLSGILPVTLAAIAAIVLGAGLFFEGVAIAAKWRSLFAQTNGGVVGEADVGGGLSAEFYGGAAGVVLGILALIGIVSTVLLPVAAIVFGGALLFGAGASASLGNGHGGEELGVIGASGQVMVGLAGVVLGIVALVGGSSMVLTLVAFLTIGAGALLSGGALAGRMMTAMHA
jgi:hypothetical protein